MSNSRVFDYAEVSNLYNQMNTITGDKSDPTSIAGILDKINIDYTDVVHGVVGEDEMAIFGELGQQMLLNWENTSANFPNFVENFSAWSTLVAQAAGDYSAFEQQVQGIKTANPLGWASGGMQDSFITTSVYANSLSEQEIAELAAVSEFHQLTGATYIDTGMVSYLKQQDFWEGVELGLDVVSVVSGIKTVKALVPQIKAASAMVTPVASSASANGFKTVTNKTTGRTSYVYDNNAPGARASGIVKQGQGLRHTMTTTGNGWQIGSGSTTNKVTQWIANTSNKAGRGFAFMGQLGKNATHNAQAVGVLKESFNVAGVDAAKLATTGMFAAGSNALAEGVAVGSSFNNPNASGTYFTTLAAGDTVQVDDKQYTFFAQAPNGTNMVADDKGNLLYQDANGKMQKVTINSGGSVVNATLDNTDDQTVLYAGSTNLGQADAMTYAFYARDNNVYVDTIEANMDLLHN
jgi:hypothetical protein